MITCEGLSTLISTQYSAVKKEKRGVKCLSSGKHDKWRARQQLDRTNFRFFVFPRLSRSPNNNKSRSFSRRRVGRSNANGAPAAPQPKRRARKAGLEVTNPLFNAIWRSAHQTKGWDPLFELSKKVKKF